VAVLSTYCFFVTSLALLGSLVTVADVKAACAAVVNPNVVLFNVPWEEFNVEKVPFLGITDPIDTLSTRPVSVGLIVSVPPACGLIVTSAFGVKLTFPLVDKFCALTFTLFTVPVVAGLIVTVPVPEGLNLICASCPSANKSPVSKIELNTPAPIILG